MKKHIILFSTVLTVISISSFSNTVLAIDEFSDKTTTTIQVPNNSIEVPSYTSENENKSEDMQTTDSTINEEPLIKQRPIREETDLINELKDAYQPVTADSLKEAQRIMGPIYKPLSLLISVILWSIFILSGLVTALDVLYIKVPFTRSFLYTAGTDGTGGVSGYNVTGGQSLFGKQWISDEAVSVVSLLGGSAQANGHAQANGVYGAGGVANTGAQSHGVQQTGGKSVLRVYLTRRIFTLILLGAMVPILLTPFFIDLGFNVGSMILDIVYTISTFFF